MDTPSCHIGETRVKIEGDATNETTKNIDAEAPEPNAHVRDEEGLPSCAGKPEAGSLAVIRVEGLRRKVVFALRRCIRCGHVGLFLATRGDDDQQARLRREAVATVREFLRGFKPD